MKRLLSFVSRAGASPAAAGTTDARRATVSGVDADGGRQGMVLITVLWVIMFMVLLAAGVAGGIRLSALAAHGLQKAGNRLADRISAVEMAKMELMLIRMPKPLHREGQTPENPPGAGKERKEAYRMNGRDLRLFYPLPEGMGVRIWDHAGKINLRRLTVARMREIVLKLLPEKRDALLDGLVNSWLDWVDTDDLTRIGGAEKQYYLSLKEPVEPRNGPVETVDEILLIRGFAELLDGIDVHEVFTVYGNTSQVNFNLATRNVLLLIPGLDEEDVDAILRLRKDQEIRSSKDLAPFVPPAHLRQAMAWMSFATSNYYTIGVYDKEQAAASRSISAGGEDAPDSGTRWGYAEVVRARGYRRLPETRLVMPLVLLPGYPPAEDSTGEGLASGAASRQTL